MVHGTVTRAAVHIGVPKRSTSSCPASPISSQPTVTVVDTTVWIDYFAGRDEEPHVAELLRLVDADAGIALTDVIVGEILQGLRGEHTVRRVDKRLRAFDILRLHALDDSRNAAALYRHARSEGRTIRRTLDCLIATVCIREDCAILHNDRDFDHLADVTDLVVHTAPDDRTVP